MTDTHKEKFIIAYELYSEAIYRHCYFRVFSKARAEEFTQETFTKAWEYVAAGKEVENMRAFLYRVATNLIIDDVRKKKEDSLDAMLEDNPSLEPADDGHKDIEMGILLNDVKKHMKQLSSSDREVLTLRYIDDMDPKEIAEVLGMRSNAVSVRINRAIQALKKIAN